MLKVAIVGRPNVGKSTLFNRLIGRRKSIVEPTPGVTRDVNEEVFDIAGAPVLLYDTGGLIDELDDPLNSKVQERSFTVASVADLIFFVVEVGTLHPDDEHFARMLRKCSAPVILVVNKVDADSREAGVYEFAKLGFKTTLAISSEHGRGIEDIFEAIEARMNEGDRTTEVFDDEEKDDVRIAIVGKPNTGKSTFLNTLLDETRSIVSDIAGTTRDPIDAVIAFREQRVRLVDTAGIRRKKKVTENVEYYSVNRAIKSIERCDVAILLIDVAQGLTEQDKKIARLIIENRKGILIGVNKWDAREKGVTWPDYEAYLRSEFPVLPYATFLRLSGMKKRDAFQTLGHAHRIAGIRHSKIDTHALTEVLHKATLAYSFSAGRTSFKVFYATQTGTNPPAFLIFSNYPDKLTANYKKYLENKVREIFDFQGTPIVLNYKKRESE